jgi:hypothetical protein
MNAYKLMIASSIAAKVDYERLSPPGCISASPTGPWPGDSEGAPPVHGAQVCVLGRSCTPKLQHHCMLVSEDGAQLTQGLTFTHSHVC